MGSPRAAFFLMSALALGGLAPSALERWSEGPQQVSQAIPAEAITERLLALLPDDQIIQSGNERTTVKELKAIREVEVERVRQEAIVLFNKARSASGADRDKIGRRAAELLNTLNKLGVR